MTRGSTHTFEVRLFGPDGSDYEPLKGDVLRFGVKYEDGFGNYLLMKQTQQLEGGIAWFVLNPEDTMTMEPGRYYFDIGLQSGEMYLPVVPYSAFILEPNITSKE